MPKQKQYEDALGSVFDFIFTESQKRPDKRKPVKVTGVDGTSEYVDAIAAVLESPGQFVNKTTVDAFNDIVNPDLAVIDLGPNEKVKFSLLNVKSALENDLSFIDKGFAKIEADRKLGKLAWAGQQLSGVVAATWAKKYGLDLGTQDALFNMGTDGAFLTKNLKKPESSLGAWGKNREYLEKVVKGEFGDYRNVSEDVFKKSFGEKNGTKIYKELQEAFKVYDDAIQNEKNSEEISAILDKSSDKNYQTLYPVFESHSISMKEAVARADGNIELANKYKAAQKGVDIFAQRGLRERYVLEKKFELKQYKKDLSTMLKSKGYSKEDVKNLKTKISDVNKELRMFKLQESALKLGEWDGMISSVQGVWDYTAGGQLIPAILTGDFYNKDKNTIFGGRYMPVQEKEILGISRFVPSGKGDMPKFKIPKVGNNKFMNQYYEMMTDMYYMTPASWVKTLANGEGFAYRAFKQQNKFLKMMEREGWTDKIDLTKLFGEDGKAYLDSFTSILDQEKFDKLLKFVKKNERLQKMAYRFGAFGRGKEKITKFFTKKLAVPMKKLRQEVGKALLKVIKDGPARKLIGKWMYSGGFKVLLEGVKTAVKAALGVTTAGAGLLVGFLVDIAANIVVDIGMKIAKPVIKFGISIALIVISGIIGVIIVFSTFFVSKNSQYAHVAPNEIVLGQTDYKVPEDSSVGSGTPFNAAPLPDGVSCLLGSPDYYRCTQGPGGSYSHRCLPNAIDIGYAGYFYAPSFCGEGNCTVLENGDYPGCNGYAGGQVIFEAQYGGNTYKFKLVHVEMDPALSVGSELEAGQVVARIMSHSETGSACSTGTHLHLEGWLNNEIVDPSSVLREDPAGGGFGCNLSSCE